MVYLTELQTELYATASQRERLLYDYLKGQTSSLDPTKLKPEEKFCHDSLFLNSGEEELAKIRAVKPFKGMHYSTNLTLLIAAALLDPYGEKENLENYIKNCTESERFIINSVIDNDFPFSGNIATPVDSLAIKLTSEELLNDSDLIKCIGNLKTLFDYFVFESGVCRKAYQIEKESKLPEYKAFTSLTLSAVARVKFFIKTVLLLALFIIGYYLIPQITSLTVEYWDTLEPLVWLVNIGISLLLVVTGVVLVEVFKKTKEKINQAIEKVTCFLLGFNYRDYLKLITELEE